MYLSKTAQCDQTVLFSSSEEIRKDFKEVIVFELGTSVWEEFGNSEVLRKHSK